MRRPKLKIVPVLLALIARMPIGLRVKTGVR
jgi:hypothetical protein